MTVCNCVGIPVSCVEGFGCDILEVSDFIKFLILGLFEISNFVEFHLNYCANVCSHFLKACT